MLQTSYSHTSFCSSFVEPSTETLKELREPTFDNWQWEDAEMLFLLQQMFVDLGLMQAFHIEVSFFVFSFNLVLEYLRILFHSRFTDNDEQFCFSAQHSLCRILLGNGIV